MTAHALFSPSSAHRWFNCPGSLAMEQEHPPALEKINQAALEGSALHQLASLILTESIVDLTAFSFIGQTLFGSNVTFTEEMCEIVQEYVDAIKEKKGIFYLQGASKVDVFIEDRVDFSEVIGIPHQFGTSDAIFIVYWPDETITLSIEDAKFGKYLVEAKDNLQLILYALGAFTKYGSLSKIKEIILTIHQPSRSHTSEWSFSIEELQTFAHALKDSATTAYQCLVQWNDLSLEQKKKYLSPGEEQCKYCKAKWNCPSVVRKIEETVSSSLSSLTKEHVHDTMNHVRQLPDDIKSKRLSELMMVVPLIEMLSKAIREETTQTINNGYSIPGWKIAPGRKGIRTWNDEEAVRETLYTCGFTYESAHQISLISPTHVEKILSKSYPEQWTTLQNFYISQKEGYPSLVLDLESRSSTTTTSFL